MSFVEEVLINLLQLEGLAHLNADVVPNHQLVAPQARQEENGPGESRLGWRPTTRFSRMTLRKQVYKITYPNGKIYVGQTSPAASHTSAARVPKHA